jgi:short-subunit dehydrogenase
MPPPIFSKIERWHGRCTVHFEQWEVSVAEKSRYWPVAAAGIGLYVGWRRLKTWRQINFRGKTTLITGGSRGLGLLLARQLIADGARVAICARDFEELDRAVQDLAHYGGNALAIPCDLTDEARVNEMVAVVEQRLGPIDLLVNNAGNIIVGPIDTMRSEDFEASMDVNFYGALFTTLAVLPSMRRRGRGRIVNIASIGGKLSVPHLLPYCASKFALVGFSEGLRSELAGTGISVTTVCPGLMRTGSARQALFKGSVREEHAWFSASSSLPGITMSAERAARQILEAAARGDSEVTLSLPAKMIRLVHGIAPGLTSDVLGIVNRALPDSGGGVDTRIAGKAIEPCRSSWLTALGDRAAHRNNEIDPDEQARKAPACS